MPSRYEWMMSFTMFALVGMLAVAPPAHARIHAEPKYHDAAGRAESPKQLNDPLPPAAMPETNAPPHRAEVTPRGVPEGMGNETDMSKTPGDDDASDGVDEPGRDPIPGMPRREPGKDKRPPAAK